MLDRENAPIRRVMDDKGNPLSVKVPVIDPPIYLEVWKVQVGKTDLYLIDTSARPTIPGTAASLIGSTPGTWSSGCGRRSC